MNDSGTTTDLDQTDEEILTYTVSDEALEATAGAGRPPTARTNVACTFTTCIGQEVNGRLQHHG
jgi:hypothetical protein